MTGTRFKAALQAAVKKSFTSEATGIARYEQRVHYMEAKC